jgi:hypothetical protein
MSLEEKLEIALEALKFYTSRDIIAPCGIESTEGWTAEFGEKARQAIEKIEGRDK